MAMTREAAAPIVVENLVGNLVDGMVDGPGLRSAPGWYRVLVVEDELDQRKLLCQNLESWGHQVCAVDSGEAALRVWGQLELDLVLLDLTLPGLSGIEVWRAMQASARRPRPNIFLMLNLWSDEIDWIAEQDVCVEDYLVRPFSFRELKLRMDTRLRPRTAAVGPAAGVSLVGGAGPEPRPRRWFTFGPLQVDVDGCHVYVEGREVPLSAMEMQLLVYFCQSHGFLCSRKLLLTSVWGYQPGVSSRTVDVCIKRLRDKLGPAGRLVETVRGLGYRFASREGDAAQR
jgi:two-component system, OmpR family, phosphate regulon response regulator PhoB